jgi:hypothetical protein
MLQTLEALFTTEHCKSKAKTKENEKQANIRAYRT